MKNFIFLWTFLVSSAMVWAQKGPKIEVLHPDNTIDYGIVEKTTDNGIRTFEIKNVGDAPLVVVDVKSTCGCTVPSKPAEQIMPGKVGKIEVKYNMAPGPIRKTITVETNAVNVPDGRVALKIKGEVKSPPSATSPLTKKPANMMQAN